MVWFGRLAFTKGLMAGMNSIFLLQMLLFGPRLPQGFDRWGGL